VQLAIVFRETVPKEPDVVSYVTRTPFLAFSAVGSFNIHLVQIHGVSGARR